MDNTPPYPYPIYTPSPIHKWPCIYPFLPFWKWKVSHTCSRKPMLERSFCSLNHDAGKKSIYNIYIYTYINLAPIKSAIYS